MNRIITLLLISAGLFACCTGKQPDKTKETIHLLNNLKQIPTKGFLFGHHDDPVYGIGWEGDPGRSDIKSVCGAYPAVMSFDLGHIETGEHQNLDKVPFQTIRTHIIEHYQRGGMISLSWHPRNPLTGGDSWDVTDTTVVASILPGGKNHDLFTGWLDSVATFINSLKTAGGTPIPILFRPWHEHTGSWFWWGQKLCSTRQYKELWHLTYQQLQKKQVKNILYAYSPGMESGNVAEYLERYPGDQIIDLLGIDIYQYERSEYIRELEKSLTILSEAGRMHDKPIAITETGFEAIPDSCWWTGTLLPIVEKYPLSYVLVWRNAREKENHYYAPYPEQISANDFIRFYHSPKTLFIGDKFELYK
ncbi:MAG: beta-mannosidase [Tannerellaceae bacterium]|nr:beta-mannosidase [Tannerellaceae bacterium]